MRALELLEPRVVLSTDLAWAFEVEVPASETMQAPDIQETHEHVLATDAFGNQFHSEPVVDGPQEAAQAAAGSGDATVWQGYDLSETFFLHSNPTADHVIYLDFDGHVTSGTIWNDAFADGNDIVTPSFSSDGDSSSFSDAEKALIQRVWARVAEDYAPFDLDVTTEEPSLDRLIKSGAGDTQWGTRAVIGPNTWFDPAGGVAYVGSFDWSTDAPCFVFNTSEVGVAESVSHESGHTLGLSHDGDPSTAYYTGHGSGNTSWGPIMGAPYNMSLSQWSAGEYSNANNTEDDLSIIASQNGFGYRTDDFGDTLDDATELIAAGQSQIDAFYGLIEQNTDYDVFSFQANAGTASLAIDPLAIGPNLDILAELYDATGSLISSSNPIDDINASFSLSLPTAGNYLLRVSGTGRGDPLTDGYTDYGSLGNYRITGTVNPYTTENTPPVAVDDQGTTSVNAAVTVDVLANDSDADSDPLSVSSVTQGSNGTVAINADETVTYTPSNDFVGVDSFSYTISDGAGGSDTASVTITVTGTSALANGDFEQGMTGWEVTGDASTQTASFGETPPQGVYQAVLSTANAAGGNVTVSELESFLGLGSGTLDAIAPGTATAGTAIRQQVSAAAGETLVLQYNFATNESTPDSTYNDFSFLAVAGPTEQEAFLLADTTASGFQSSASTYKESTGYREFTYAFPSTGLYTIGFGVSESKDTSYDTALLVDAVSLENSTNTPPTANDDTTTTDEDQPVTSDVLANDSDSDGGTLVVVNATQGASGAVQVNGDNTVTYTPNANYFGSDTFTYTVSDSQGGQATGTVAVTVTPVNDNPVGVDDAATTAESVAVTVDVLANDSDVDGDTLSIASVQQPTWGNAVVNADGTITYSPNTGYSGTDIFSYTAIDGNGGQTTAEVTVTVTEGANNPPVATDDGTSTNEDTSVSIGVLANDSDPDGDTLTVAGITQPGHGTTVLNANQTVSYTPAANYFGTDTFTYTADDGNGGQASATVTVTVAAVNDSPSTTTDNTSVTEDGVVTLDPAANDSDVDGDTLTISSVGQAASGSTVLNANSTVTYTPGADFSGTDSFTYTVVDGQGGQATGTVLVTVTPVNDAPVATDDSASTSTDVPIVVDVLSNDGDVDGDTLTVVGLSQPSSGATVVNADDSITYTPSSGFTGDDAFTYTIDDGHGAQSTATVTVSVDDSGEVTIDGFENGLSQWAIMGDAKTLDSSFGEAPAAGQYQAVVTTTNAQGGNATAADLEAFLGVSSGALDATTVGTATSGSAISRTLTVTAGQTLDLQMSFLTNESTPDNNYNDFAFITVVGPGVNTALLLADTHSAGFTASPTSYSQSTGYGSYSFTFPNAGEYTIGLGVSDARDTSYDSALLVDEVTLSGTTPAGNTPPVAVGDTESTAEDNAVAIAVLANDSDADGDTLTIASVTQGSHGSVVVSDGTSVTYTPQANYNGTDTFSYTIADGQGGQDTAVVTVTVDSVNDAPVGVDDAAAATSATTATFSVVDNDTDVDGDPLTVAAVTQPANGTVVINPDNSLSYTSDSGFTGVDSFSYTVDDGQGGQDSASVTITVTGSASGLVNGDFEDDLSGWESTGDASVQTAAFGESPVSGQYQGLVTSVNAAGGYIPVADLEDFLGLNSGTLDGVAVGTATAGSAIRQTVTVAAGQVLVFQYNFATNENTPENTYNDFSFLSIVGGGVQTAVLVADTHATNFSASPSTYKNSTGYQSFSYAFAQGGEYTIGFGVADSKDTSYDSALLLDGINLQSGPAAAAPETPGTPSGPSASLPDWGFTSPASGSSAAMLNSGSLLPEAAACDATEGKTGLTAESGFSGLAIGSSQLDDSDAVDAPSTDWATLVDQLFANFQLD